MAKEIIINAMQEETRVAFLENRVVTALYIDRKKERGIVGNVYKGKIMKVLPGMQAAFVDIGTEKSAFLYVADVVFQKEETLRVTEGEGEEYREDDNVEFNGIVTKVKKSGGKPIEELLKEGQEILVQVTKEPMGTKGPRVTMYVSLPGRYLVFMPTVNHVGISRRINKEEERSRLRDMIMKMRKGGTGYIIRTVSDGVSEEEFVSDKEFLDVLWHNINKKRERLGAPVLLHTDLDLVFRTVRDLFTRDVDRLVIDSKVEYERIKDFVNMYIPSLSERVELYEKEEQIFDAFEVEIEISRGLGRKVWLKSGGYIIIDHTEALTVIDVNTGRYVGKRDLEETILKTNLDSVKEIAYQLRLRNIGGIIIIDFIDMEKERNRDKVFHAFQEAVSRDKARTNILRISDLGLIQMSRERIRENLLRILCGPCPYCDGKGYTKSPMTVCYEIFREIRRIGPSQHDKKIILGVHPTVANLLYEEEREGIEDLEREFNRKIFIKADSNLHLEQYDLSTH
jgi:ribonuclease G